MIRDEITEQKEKENEKSYLSVIVLFMLLPILPAAYSCTCTAGGATCSGNCCWYDNGQCVCVDFGHPACPNPNV
jgi:hypothetical protein